jgi:hypothetical protein
MFMKMMNTIRLFFFAGIVSVLFASCQNEENEMTVAETDTLSKAAQLTNLLQRVSMVDTSSDNILDSTDCFKVKLPVEVLVNNQPILVTSEDDFATIEATFDLFPSEYNTVDLVFPVTIIYPDSTELTVGSEQVFDALAHECETAVMPQPINCLTIVYPISINTYNSESQLTDTFTLQNDAQLMAFIMGLNTQDFYAVNYPITIINHEGESIAVNSNNQLVSLILQAIEDCEVVEPVGCESGVSYFSAAYESIKGMDNVQELFSMDALIHEYKFEVNADKTICTVGYRGEQWSTPVNYTIEIEDQAGNIIFTTEHAFSSSQIEYISVNTATGGDITLAPGAVYTIRRIVQPGEGTGMGMFIERSQNQGPQPPLLPFDNGNIKILESRFYGNGGTTDPDLYRVPFIDIVFKN